MLHPEYFEVQTKRKINSTGIIKEDFTKKQYFSYVPKEE